MYIYIFEDGTTQIHSAHPTKGDLDSIDAGILTVLKCDSVQPVYIYEVAEDSSLSVVPQCGIEDFGGTEYHVPRRRDH